MRPHLDVPHQTSCRRRLSEQKRRSRRRIHREVQWRCIGRHRSYSQRSINAANFTVAAPTDLVLERQRAARAHKSALEARHVLALGPQVVHSCLDDERCTALPLLWRP